jgi:lysophospholipase L1-like esterase
VAHPLVSRPALAMYALGALIAVPYALPPSVTIVPLPGKAKITVGRLRLLSARDEPAASEPVVPVPDPIASVGAVALDITTDDRATAAQAEPAPQRPSLPFGRANEGVAAPPIDEAPPRPIEDATGHALDAFYGSLSAVDAKTPGAIARVTYYGDSVIASDWITSTLRRKLQARFGDAGHGFVLPADAWPGYHHDGVNRYASKGWKVSRVVGPYSPDGLYGLGGVSFVAEGPGTYAMVSTSTSGIGQRASRFLVTYAEGPGGGTLGLKLDDAPPRMLPTAAEATQVKTALFEVPDGPHKLEVRSHGGGPVRVFHVVMERDEPGAVVDAIGIIGCRLRFLDKLDDAHWAEELKRRNPSLVAFTYGANESADGFAYPMDQYEVTARAVLKQVREALPGASCLLVGPMDAAEKRGEGFSTRPVVPAIVDVQRKLAAELGCGFFDTFRAMGGHGSMGVWIQRGLGGADLIHPTSTGAEVIGGWVYRALMDGYSRYRERPAGGRNDAGAD